MELHHQTAPSINCLFIKYGVILLQALTETLALFYSFVKTAKLLKSANHLSGITMRLGPFPMAVGG
jgi:hypothetical protein